MTGGPARRVLILGGTGLISTGITRQLLDRGDEVVLFTRGSTAHGFGDRVVDVRGDRSSRTDLDRVLAAGPFDAVIDMICYTAGDAEVLVAALEGAPAPVPQLLMCSTVDVYTKPAPAQPVSESAERRPARTFPYAFAKQEAETVLESAATRGVVSLTVLRPAATYEGFAVAPVGGYPVSIARLRAGLPLIMPGDGSSFWASCHRDDVAAAFVAAVGNPLAIGRAYTLAGSELITWNQYWQTIAEALGVEASFVHIPTDTLYRMSPELAEWCWMNFQYGTVFDCSAAAADLGFRMRRTWAEGVAGFDLDGVAEPDPDAAAAYDDLVRAWQRAETDLTRSLQETS